MQRRNPLIEHFGKFNGRFTAFYYNPCLSGQLFHAFATSLMFRYIPIVFHCHRPPGSFGQQHQVIDVLGVHAEHIFVGVEVKQIHAAVVFLELLDHAPDKPLPILAAADQSQPSEFLCPESVTDFSRREIA